MCTILHVSQTWVSTIYLCLLPALNILIECKCLSDHGGWLVQVRRQEDGVRLLRQVRKGGHVLFCHCQIRRAASTLNFVCLLELTNLFLEIRFAKKNSHLYGSNIFQMREIWNWPVYSAQQRPARWLLHALRPSLEPLAPRPVPRLSEI